MYAFDRWFRTPKRRPEIEEILEELADGLDILAATLSHALILSIQSGNFNRAR